MEKEPRIITPMPADLVERIDNFRYANRIPSRSEAVRKLIEAGLSAHSAKDAQPKARQ
jgi:metal-responsive CopG/Arc/MetJ family transcriptional regulator